MDFACPVSSSMVFQRPVTASLALPGNEAATSMVARIAEVANTRMIDLQVDAVWRVKAMVGSVAALVLRRMAVEAPYSASSAGGHIVTATRLSQLTPAYAGSFSRSTTNEQLSVGVRPRDLSLPLIVSICTSSAPLPVSDLR